MEWNCSIFLSSVHAGFEWQAATCVEEHIGQTGHFSVSGLYITPGIRFVTHTYTHPWFIRLGLIYAYPVWKDPPLLVLVMTDGLVLCCVKVRPDFRISFCVVLSLSAMWPHLVYFCYFLTSLPLQMGLDSFPLHFHTLSQRNVTVIHWEGVRSMTWTYCLDNRWGTFNSHEIIKRASL